MKVLSSKPIQDIRRKVGKLLQKHRMLFWGWIAFDILIIALPQWLDAVWSLADRMHGQVSMPDTSWLFAVTIPIGVAMVGIAIWAVKSPKPTEARLTAAKSRNVGDTLTQMHRRLVELQQEKASHTRVNYRKIERVASTLADRMGIVRFRDWARFNQDVRRRIRRKSPRRRPTYQGLREHGLKKYWLEQKTYKERVEQAGLIVASEVKMELFQSKEWTFDDGMAISNWLDGHHWGVKERRDNDAQWESLRRSISHHLEDAELRELIERHIDFSLMSNNVRLFLLYSEDYPKSTFGSMLHEVLVGSPISPEKVEAGLAEVLADINKRLTEIRKGRGKKEAR